MSMGAAAAIASNVAGAASASTCASEAAAKNAVPPRSLCVRGACVRRCGTTVEQHARVCRSTCPDGCAQRLARRWLEHLPPQARAAELPRVPRRRRLRAQPHPSLVQRVRWRKRLRAQPRAAHVQGVSGGRGRPLGALQAPAAPVQVQRVRPVETLRASAYTGPLQGVHVLSWRWRRQSNHQTFASRTRAQRRDGGQQDRTGWHGEQSARGPTAARSTAYCRFVSCPGCAPPRPVERALRHACVSLLHPPCLWERMSARATAGFPSATACRHTGCLEQAMHAFPFACPQADI